MSPLASSPEITRLLSEWSATRPDAAELWSVIYGELRRIAAAYMRNERPDHTLQTTALVNEAYIRLFEGRPFRWESRKHFFCVMAQIMRRILVDHARERYTHKRGGEWKKISLDAGPPPVNGEPEQFLAIDEALERLANLSPRKAQVVELRFFAGLTADETAAMLSVSPETVKLDWRFARAWLQRQLQPEDARASTANREPAGGHEDDL